MAMTAADVRERAKVMQQKLKAGKKKQATTTQALESLGIVPSWTEYKELRMLNFDDMVEKRTQIKDEIEFRKAKLDQLDDQIQAAMAVAGTEKVLWEDRPVQVVHSRSGSKIVAEKLLISGVSADVIAECTEAGKEYSYLLVGKPSK